MSRKVRIAANGELGICYAYTTRADHTYAIFSDCEQVTDVSLNGNCLMFGDGIAAFHGDYNELDAIWTGSNHIVHLAWADNRDVNPCDLRQDLIRIIRAIATKTSMPIH